MDRANLTWVRLTCPRRHTQLYTIKGKAPEEGEELWCPRCNCFAHVSEVVSKKELRLNKCLAPDCKYARNFGTANAAAKLSATKHAAKHPGHEVTVSDGNDKVLQTSYRAEDQGELELPPY